MKFIFSRFKLFFPLLILFTIYILPASVYAQTTVIPTLYCLGNCPTITQANLATPPPLISPALSPSTGANPSPNPTTAGASPTIDPCTPPIAVNVFHNDRERNGTNKDRHNLGGDGKGLLQLIIELLQLLLNLLGQLLGGGVIPPITPTPTPQVSTTPVPSTAAPTPVSTTGSPSPAPASPTLTTAPPCPTLTQATATVTIVPSASPTPTVFQMPSPPPPLPTTVTSTPPVNTQAKLIIEEQFPNNNLGSRGWHPNYSSSPIKQSMPVLLDSQLGKNYLKIQWTGGSQDPVGYSESMFLDFPKTYKEVTVRFYVKMVSWGKWGQDNHFLGIFLHPFKWADRNEVYFEPQNQGGNSGRNFQIGLDSVPYGVRWDEKHTASTDNVMQMNTWYEFRGHFRTNTTGQSNGEYVLEMKPALGGGSWTRVVDHPRKNWPYSNGFNPQGFGSIGIRPHMHSGGTGEIHLASYQVYEGNQLGVNLP